MDKLEIEKNLAELMDMVPECEGLIAAEPDGKVIIGQTITQMDHGTIAKSCATLVKDVKNLSDKLSKGNLKDMTVELDSGFAVIVGSKTLVLVALAGTDGKASLGLLKRKLINIANS